MNDGLEVMNVHFIFITGDFLHGDQRHLIR